MKAKPVSHAVEQGPHATLGRGIRAFYLAHDPAAPVRGDSVAHPVSSMRSDGSVSCLETIALYRATRSLAVVTRPSSAKRPSS